MKHFSLETPFKKTQLSDKDSVITIKLYESQISVNAIKKNILRTSLTPLCAL